MALRERQKEAFKKRYGINLGIASFFVKAARGRAQGVPAAQRRNPGRRDRLQALLRHRHGGGRRRRAGGAGAAQRRNDGVCRSRDGDPRVREEARPTAPSRSRIWRAAPSPSPTAASSARCSARRSSTRRRWASSACTRFRTAPSPSTARSSIRPMMYVALSYDHRIVDGREAVQFLVKIKEFIEDPGHLLLESCSSASRASRLCLARQCPIARPPGGRSGSLLKHMRHRSARRRDRACRRRPVDAARRRRAGRRSGGAARCHRAAGRRREERHRPHLQSGAARARAARSRPRPTS